MRPRTPFPVAVVLLTAGMMAATASAADQYSFDRAHSSIGFAVRHMVVTKVKGYFDDFTGTVLFDEKDITKSSVEVSIKTASVNTKEAKRDEHLRSPDFFDTPKYPEITFKSKRIEKSGDSYAAVGDLTMHGVTKEIRVPFALAGVVTDPWGNTRLGLSAATTLNRQDYGISWSQKLDSGGLVVGDDVEIEIEIEAIKAK